MEFARQTTPDGTTRLSLDGDLTIYRAGEIRQRLIEDVRANGVLELDLSRVGEIDTAGLQVLALAKRESHRLDHVLRIVDHSPVVRETIEFLNMAAFFGDPLLIPANARN